MKSGRIKKLLLAVSGLAVYQMAGCNFIEQLQALFPNIGG